MTNHNSSQDHLNEKHEVCYCKCISHASHRQVSVKHCFVYRVLVIAHAVSHKLLFVHYTARWYSQLILFSNFLIRSTQYRHHYEALASSPGFDLLIKSKRKNGKESIEEKKITAKPGPRSHSKILNFD